MAEHHVLFYDGVCGLCDRLVRFVLARDSRRRFRFAALQGEVARQTLIARGRDPGALDTVYVLSADGRLLRKSRAVFFVLASLGGGWRLLSGLRLLPVWLTDRGYDLVARVRYRVFGRLDSCPLPPPQARALFLD